ncbi:nrap protein [Plectosphaerella plurivora]|uniref:U3 small nucleolar RNA-associated protein 22 n=1 Tax=Plectosphaerella plurivora TaxID=936078 RepID=A0A9P8V599_9PEZI|nr:nrap protein [Plectosphaerella plurivora]
MVPSPKRRKVSHADGGAQSRASTASPFVLQTAELLEEVDVDYEDSFAGADDLLKRLRDVVDSIPAVAEASIAEATRKLQKKHDIQIPFPEPKPAADSPYKLAYEKPASYNVVGSYVSKTMTKDQEAKTIDMIVQMPKSLFQEKDFQSMRYFYRRAYYIANIAAGVRQNLGSDVEVEFDLLNENPLLPVLTIHPTETADDEDDDKVENEDEEDDDSSSDGSENSTNVSEYSIRIIPCAPENLFPKNKLVSTANCNKAANSDAPTPFYNSTIKAEESFIRYLRTLARAKTQCGAFADACKLGRIWLQQRGFGASLSLGGFGHFEWAFLMAMLLQKGDKSDKPALSSSLSSTELFKATVQFIASTDFVKNPVVFGTYPKGYDAVRESGPVMFDTDRELNFLYKMTPWSANLLRHYATTTLEVLNSNSLDQFEATFIVKADVSLQMFDAVFEIEDIDLEKFSSVTDGRGPASAFCAKVFTTLSKAFKERATLIHIQHSETESWDISSSPETGSATVQIGLLFDPVTMAKSLELGPSAELTKEAAKFRQFWGEKAELRRFKDGSILECVPWSQKTAANICEEITKYILGLHLKIDLDTIRFHGQNLPSGLEFTPVDREAFDAARQAFQAFEHDIRSLEGMPLSVRRLAPICPELRYSSMSPPALGFHNGNVPAMDVALSFEASGRWPENLVAIQETKIDFLLDIDRRLTAANDKVTTSLGRDNSSDETGNIAFLDIVYPSGVAFRLRIQSDLEETLLERNARNKLLDPHTRLAAEEALSRLRWKHTHLPLHAQSIASFCTRLAPLSAAMRLTKHWFNAHKLTGQISEELIELFVAHVFLQPQPWKTPSSAQAAFLRTLVFLSRWDWRSEALVVDFSDELTPDDYAAVDRRLETSRTRDPNMNHAVLFAATTHDTSGLAYTQNGPSKLCATRMTRLAKSACALVREQGVDLDLDDLFEPSLGDYDILIHLSSGQTKRVLRDAGAEAGARHSTFKNLDARTGKVPLPLAAHPVDVLLGQLEAAYQDSLIFFRGAQGDSTVGAIWQPKLRRQAFRVGLPYNFRTAEEAEDEHAVDVNKEAIILEIARIGGDMIKKIETAE